MSRADAIASCVLETFDKLPANRKPVLRTNGVREWVPLSGIVAELQDGQFVCLALATGMKCLPASKMPAANGVGLHDWHAEVLVMRAFNHFVLRECQNVVEDGDDASLFVRMRQRSEGKQEAVSENEPQSEQQTEQETTQDDDDDLWHGQPFAWKDDAGISLHMYCSEAPCGDASMELTMAAQEDASPWKVPENNAASGNPGNTPTTLPGRAFFSQLGAVRRKPGRGDAPATLSKSCSDKLALRQCTSLLSGLLSLLVAPSRGVYLQTIVVPTTQYSAQGWRRAFGERMERVVNSEWPGGYRFVSFSVATTSLEFAFSKRATTMNTTTKMASSNLSVAWTYEGALDECLVGGVLRGRKAFDPAGTSAVARRRMWKLAREVVATADGSELLRKTLDAKTYGDLKADVLLAARRRVKDNVKEEALRGWIPNQGDDDWGLEVW